MNVGAPRTLAHSWLLLIHQLPAKPAYLRVKIWRRLQDLGAVAVKNAVHALPMNEETQEDFACAPAACAEAGGIAIAAVKATATKAAALQPICPALVLMTETLNLMRRPPQNR